MFLLLMFLNGITKELIFAVKIFIDYVLKMFSGKQILVALRI